MPTSSPDLTEMHQRPSLEFLSRLKGRIMPIASNLSEFGPQIALSAGLLDQSRASVSETAIRDGSGQRMSRWSESVDRFDSEPAADLARIVQ